MMVEIKVSHCVVTLRLQCVDMQVSNETLYYSLTQQ